MRQERELLKDQTEGVYKKNLKTKRKEKTKPRII